MYHLNTAALLFQKLYHETMHIQRETEDALRSFSYLISAKYISWSLRYSDFLKLSFTFLTYYLVFQKNLITQQFSACYDLQIKGTRKVFSLPYHFYYECLAYFLTQKIIVYDLILVHHQIIKQITLSIVLQVDSAIVSFNAYCVFIYFEFRLHKETFI